MIPQQHDHMPGWEVLLQDRESNNNWGLMFYDNYVELFVHLRLYSNDQRTSHSLPPLNDPNTSTPPN